MIKKVNSQRNDREAEEPGLDHSQEPRESWQQRTKTLSAMATGGPPIGLLTSATVSAPMVTSTLAILPPHPTVHNPQLSLFSSDPQPSQIQVQGKKIPLQNLFHIPKHLLPWSKKEISGSFISKVRGRALLITKTQTLRDNQKRKRFRCWYFKNKQQK